ncbi:MAG: exodeoxyribonuclease VII small subunit [Clostridia bacterium]
MELEKKLNELEEIVEKIQNKDTKLDESLTLFNAGVKLSTECLTELESVKGQIYLLTKELDKKEI